MTHTRKHPDEILAISNAGYLTEKVSRIDAYLLGYLKEPTEERLEYLRYLLDDWRINAPKYNLDRVKIVYEVTPTPLDFRPMLPREHYDEERERERAKYRELSEQYNAVVRKLNDIESKQRLRQKPQYEADSWGLESIGFSKTTKDVEREAKRLARAEAKAQRELAKQAEIQAREEAKAIKAEARALAKEEAKAQRELAKQAKVQAREEAKAMKAEAKALAKEEAKATKDRAMDLAKEEAKAKAEAAREARSLASAEARAKREAEAEARRAAREAKRAPKRVIEYLPVNELDYNGLKLPYVVHEGRRWFLAEKTLAAFGVGIHWLKPGRAPVGQENRRRDLNLVGIKRPTLITWEGLEIVGKRAGFI